MRLDISFKHTRPRDEVKRRADVLFGKLERFLDPAAEGQLIIAREHDAFVVEITVTTHGQVFKAQDDDEDLRTALDRMFHTIEEALRRAKDKRVDRWRTAGDKPDGFVPAGDDDEDVASA